MRPVVDPGLRMQIAARTRFFDEAVLAGIERGLAQVVILGAGYDDRALRFRAPGVRFFELDHPDTQADKRRRLRASRARTDQLVLAAADFRNDDVGGTLERVGHDRAQATLFLCEGLLVYLGGPAIVALLAALAARATAESALVASFAVHADGLDSSFVAATANTRRRLGQAEPWLTILPLASHLELLHDAGWTETEVLDDSDLAAEAARGRSALVAAHPTRPARADA